VRNRQFCTSSALRGGRQRLPAASAAPVSPAEPFAAALGVAVCWLAFSIGIFYAGRDALGLGLLAVQTLVFVMLVAAGHAAGRCASRPVAPGSRRWP
jgi:hypothetical protein